MRSVLLELDRAGLQLSSLLRGAGGGRAYQITFTRSIWVDRTGIYEVPSGVALTLTTDEIIQLGGAIALELAAVAGAELKLEPAEPWPTSEDVERIAIAIEEGTATGVQVARLCAIARNLVKQRAVLATGLAALQASGPEGLGP